MSKMTRFLNMCEALIIKIINIHLCKIIPSHTFIQEINKEKGRPQFQERSKI